MRLVLADTSAMLGPVIGLPLIIAVDKANICCSLMAYKHKQGDKLSDEERTKTKLVNEIWKTEDDMGGAFEVNVKPATPNWYCKETEDVKISVTPSFPQKSIFKSLVEKFQDKARISLCLERHTDNKNVVVNFASAEGMKIDPKRFTCSGNGGIYVKAHLEKFLDGYVKMHVKLVADIDVSLPPSKEVHFGRRVLEKGTCSDLIISAGNGAKIKAHRVFLSDCSPVLEAMLGSGMEESLTGEVDMMDLSEAGVWAFLRYVYYGDLEEPRDNIEVSYELFYAGHKYDVQGLEAEMRTLLLDTKNEDIDAEMAFKIYMLTRTIDTAVELKAKALGILESIGSHVDGVPCLGSKFETFLDEANYANLDVAVAFRIYMVTRNIESAVELKSKAFRVLTAKWEEWASLQEYDRFLEKPCNIKIIKELLMDLAKAANLK